MDEIGGQCGAHGEMKSAYQSFYLGISMEEDSLGICGRIILKWGSEKYRVQLTSGLNQIHDSFMASLFVLGDERLSYVKRENRINSLVELECRNLNSLACTDWSMWMAQKIERKKRGRN